MVFKFNKSSFFIGFIFIGYSALGQVELKASDLKLKKDKIHLDIAFVNKTDSTIVLDNYKKKMNVIDYLSIEEADTLNYYGMSFLVFRNTELVKIEHLPLELKHKSKIANWIDFFWLKIRNIFRQKKIRIESHSTKSERLKIDLNGLKLSQGEFSIQVVYYIKGDENFVLSNALPFYYEK